MRVWLLHVSEELPLDGTARNFRYGYLAEALQAKGHHVLRWAPTFRHRTKQHRFPRDRRISVTSQYDIQFVHSPGYRRHVSLARLHAYQVLGRRFMELAPNEPRPDLIVTAIPSLEWAEAAVVFGWLHQIPVVVDVRDVWPDIYLNALPSSLRPAGRLLLHSQFQKARRACQGAAMLTGVSQSYLDWALRHAGRQPTSSDVVLPLGFELAKLPAAQRQEKLVSLRAHGIDLQRPICLYAGRFERSYDLATVIDAAQNMASAGERDLQFVFCGGGSRSPGYQAQARGLANVHFLGWVDAPMLQTISSVATIGLCAYAKDATQSVPNKPFEYMASGLAVVSSLPGDLADMLERHECGVTYRAGDADALAGVLRALLANPFQLATMRAKAHEAWSQHYRSRDIYARFVDHVLPLAGVRRRAA